MPHAPLLRTAFITLALGVALPAQASAQAPAGVRAGKASASQLPSVTLPPALDRVLRDYELAWRAGEARKLSALFAVDGFVLQSGRAPVRGRPAIEAAYSGQGGGPLQLRALAYAAADTVGYIIGAYRYGESREDMGKFTLTLRRAAGGAWQIFSDMDNASQPPR